MKYLIASDIHGSAYWTERLCSAIESEQPDRIVLLGDLLYHGPRNDLPLSLIHISERAGKADRSRMPSSA